MICVYFREYAEDVFADAHTFATKDEASEWFNPQYFARKESGAKVTTLTEWPESKDFDPIYTGTFVKGYRVEKKGEKDIWILITKEM